jgi:hypothetical protein
MKIFIQARKDGYNVLFPKPTPKEFYQFANDIQSASAINKETYYGKTFYSLAYASGGCIFTKYVIGYDDQRNNLGNVGISVFVPNSQTLQGSDVKNLLDDLLKVYCQNYCPDYIIRNKHEDWNIFTSLANSFDAKLVSRFSNIDFSPGTQNPAFHYYETDKELIEHLDKPYQEEYSNYKQVFFIYKSLQAFANPINVLKNSGLEVNPDLNNEYFYLNNYNSTKGVIITADGNQRSNKKGETLIRVNSQVEIKYSKDDRCFEPIIAHGFLSDTASEIHKYLEIGGNQISVNYGAFYNPKPKIVTVTFEVKDQKGNAIRDGEIICKNQNNRPDDIKVIENQAVFKGEDLAERWTAVVSKDDSSGKTELLLKNPKEVAQIIVKEPIKQERTNVTIKKSAEEINERSGSSYSSRPKPIKPTPSSKRTKTLFTNPRIIAMIIVSVIVLFFLILVLISIYGEDRENGERAFDITYVVTYVDGNDLMDDELEAIKEYWQEKEKDYLQKTGGIFSSNFERSGDWNSVWEPLRKAIVAAIKKRECINKMEFDTLKLMQYSESQGNFQETINKIDDSTKYNEVVEKLDIDKVDGLTLNQIADTINAILTSNVTVKQEQIINESKENEFAQTQSTPPQPSVLENKVSEIIQYIKGDVLDIDELNEYYADGFNKELKNSIKLCLEFWTVHPNNGTSYWSLLQKVKKEKYLEVSKLKSFLERMVALDKHGKVLDYSMQYKKKGL